MEPSSAPLVVVRYWASARAAAGTAQDEVRAHTLAEALEQVRRLHAGDSRFSDVVAVCSVLVGETPVSSRDPASVRLTGDAVVELLPPFAGG